MREMWMAVVLLVSCSLSSGCTEAPQPGSKAKAPERDQIRIQGTWIGHDVGEPGDPKIVITVQDTQCDFKGGLGEFKGTLVLNPTTDPKQADLLIKEASGPTAEYMGKSALAIYKIDEDGTLTLAANEPGVAARPEKFEPTDQTKTFILKRWEPGMILPGNPPELKVLETRIGTWATETVVKPGPWNPAGSKGTGTETTEWILGGRFQQTRNTNRPAYPDNMLLCTYDPQAKAFRFWYLDDQRYVNEWTGQWDEAAQTLNWTSDGENGSRTAASMRIVGPDNIEWEMTVKDPDGKVMLEMAGKLVRKK